jgi:hypothetical protein
LSHKEIAPVVRAESSVRLLATVAVTFCLLASFAATGCAGIGEDSEKQWLEGQKETVLDAVRTIDDPSGRFARNPSPGCSPAVSTEIGWTC